MLANDIPSFYFRIFARRSFQNFVYKVADIPFELLYVKNGCKVVFFAFLCFYMSCGKKETPPLGGVSIIAANRTSALKYSYFTIHSNTPAERRLFMVTSSLRAVVFTGLKLTVQGSPLATG